MLVAGEPWVLINCHFKSKREDDLWFGTRQPPVFTSEEQRSAQIRAVLAVVDEILAVDPMARILVLGDMNESGFRPPMWIFSGGQLLNMTERVPAAERYTFNFNGNSQLLDHVLASPALAELITEVTIVHVSSDRPDSQRASDRDPVLVRLRLP